ncbi:MAG: M28 family peptidase [Candidatus Aminicenantes bacterium]|nr:M28 family peptidase [Candidatus Aminicenantes bacterium]
MRRSIVRLSIAVLAVILAATLPSAAQTRGLREIRAADMKAWLEFLAAPEFEGRNAPGTTLDIAARYIALEARRAGLKPLLPDGFLQPVPVEVTTISAAKSRLSLFTDNGQQTFFFPQAFGASVRGSSEGALAAPLVFLGSGLSAASAEWSKVELPDLRGKIAVLLDVQPAASSRPAEVSQFSSVARSRFLREKGALGMVLIIGPERETRMAEQGLVFDVSERLRFPDIETGVPGSPPAAAAQSSTAPPLPFYQVEVRHEAGAAILGVSRDALEKMFLAAKERTAVPARELDGRTLEIGLHHETRRTATPNVVGWLEGRDPVLRNEYIVLGAHHDHLASRDGRILPGADDNGSGSVALLSLAKALVAERPKRSVIFVWHTAEEDGLVGAYYFVQHCPVPVAKISANLNLDMISRNDPGMIYLIGSNKISSELDRSVHEANNRSVKLKLDYTFEDPRHTQRFFFRSDQYPYIRYGIPGVWFFCGTTADYHQPTDTFERADLAKAEKVTKLVYLVCLDIGNKPALLKLDLNPDITTRGAHNMKIDWRNLPSEAGKR